MIKTICLDLDGVYYRKGATKGFIEWLKSKGVPEDKIIDGWFKNEVRNKFRVGQISENEFWEYEKKFWGVDLDVNDILSNLTQTFEIDLLLFEAIKQFKELGLKVGICSNTNISTINSLKQKGLFPEDLDFYVLSYEVGVAKPSREIFDIVVRESNCEPNEIIYTDDNPSKLSGAQEIGMFTFVYKNFNQFKQELFKLGVKL